MNYSKECIVKNESQLLEYLINELRFNRTKAKSLLAHKLVFVNGINKSKFDTKLKKNDVIQIREKPISTYREDLELAIIYEDDDFIAIDKPVGLLTIANDVEKYETAYRMVNEYVKKRYKDQRIYILHRLDKETSGVLVFCKNEKVRDALQENWNNLITKRAYFAIVKGELVEKEKTIVNYLKSGKNNIVLTTNSKDKLAKKAITEYCVIKSNGEYSLLDVSIKTGRRNQIRVTFNDINHPIVNDLRYGKVKSSLHRLGLHAYKLSFVNPINGKEYNFETVLPMVFKRFINKKTA